MEVKAKSCIVQIEWKEWENNLPKGAGKKSGSVTKSATLAGRVKNTFRGIMNYFRNLGGKLRTDRGRKPKGTSGRAGGKTSRRMAQAGRGGR